MSYILAVYVDDCILVEKLGPFIASFKLDFASRFQIEDLGPTAWLLGCIIERDRPPWILRMGQCQYIKDIIDKFDMTPRLQHQWQPNPLRTLLQMPLLT